MFRELETRQRIFDLPSSAFVTGAGARDYSVRFHDRPAATPFGPAAGPHSQLAQNIVLSWLAGGRIIELKTVQANDHVSIPRPCIDARTVGFNVEWSQELTLDESLDEYVKASMLIRMLAASGLVGFAPGFDKYLFDVSVGYDFAGVSGDRVRAFIGTLRNAAAVIERLAAEVPAEWRRYAQADFDPCIASSVTLSTFHGCPPEDIERTAAFLLRDAGVPTIVKLNPTLLGFDEASRLLHDALGYDDIRLSRETFDADVRWDDLCAIVERLERVARGAGTGFGVKFTNTLVVENDGGFLPPAERWKYLSGAPLHVLAMHLVRRFRREFGARIPISFSGGIDRMNFSDAVALGLTPVTVCTDFLKPGGYARGHKYFAELGRRMDAAGARTIDEFVLRAYRRAEQPVSVAQAALLNTEHYVADLENDHRYARERNERAPRKVGRSLSLWDCLSCDKCVPACPNDANFTFALPVDEIPRETARRHNGGWRARVDGIVAIAMTHQIGNFADLCNDCGNCDVFCPEDGGPHRKKPRFFGSLDAWRASAPADGFYLHATATGDLMMGRFDGQEYSAFFRDGFVCYVGPGFVVEFLEKHPMSSMRGDASGDVDLTLFHVMNALRQAVLAVPGSNYVNCLQ